MSNICLKDFEKKRKLFRWTPITDRKNVFWYLGLIHVGDCFMTFFRLKIVCLHSQSRASLSHILNKESSYLFMALWPINGEISMYTYYEKGENTEHKVKGFMFCG